jgi:MFS family permease
MFFSNKNQKIIISKNFSNCIDINVINDESENLLEKSKNNPRSSHAINNKLKDYFIIYFSIFLSSLAYGIGMVMIALKLETNVKNDLLITLSTALQLSAGIFFSSFLPKLCEKIGIIRSIFYGSIIAGFATLSLCIYHNYLIWILNIFIMGISLFTTSVSRNTVMIDLSSEKHRALVISLGSCLVAISNSLGPIIINFLKTGDSELTFILCCFLHISSGLMVLFLKNNDSLIKKSRNYSPWQYISNSPKIMFSGFSYSFVMSSCSAYSIIYGLRIGLDHYQASLLLSYLLMGTIFYIPFSFLCNHLNLRLMIISFALISLICIIQIFNISNYHSIHKYFFILFACMVGMKLPSLVLINQKYQPSQRLAVNSAFSRLNLLGSVFGLITSGIFINFFGFQGLWISTGGILIIFLIFCLINFLYKFINNQISYKDFYLIKKNN